MTDFTSHEWFLGSRVIDALGRPLTVYHGRSVDFDAFNPDAGQGKSHGTGAFFSSSPAVASAYAGGVNGGNVVPAYLALRTPATIDAGGRNWNRLDKRVRVWLPSIVVPDEVEAIAAELQDRPVQPGLMKRLKPRSTTLGALFPDELVYDDDYASTDDLARWARNRGHDGLIIRNIIDCGPSGIHFTDAAREPADLFVAFRTDQIRFALAQPAGPVPEQLQLLDSAGHTAPARAALRTNRRPAAAGLEMAL